LLSSLLVRTFASRAAGLLKLTYTHMFCSLTALLFALKSPPVGYLSVLIGTIFLSFPHGLVSTNDYDRIPKDQCEHKTHLGQELVAW
jgi:hypothetical protein